MIAIGRRTDVDVERIDVAAYTVPTEAPEGDGTLRWDETSLVVAHVHGGGMAGLGYSYAAPAAADLIRRTLAPVVEGADAFAIDDAWRSMLRTVRNVGRGGIAASAISAVDAAMWDLKARLLDLPLVRLLGGTARPGAVYGSGGFTTYDVPRLRDQLAGWVDEGIHAVKMKVGSEPERDPARVSAARQAIGARAVLMVDANGAYHPAQALAMAQAFAADGVTWFEEPVSSDDLAGLRWIRERAPGGMEIAAGEYGYDPWYFAQMLRAGAVDVLQADATRCCGITGFMRAAALAEAHHVPLSAHTAPSLHLHPAAAAGETLRHVEYFHDHVRIERLLFEGAAVARDGAIQPDVERAGMGLSPRGADAAPFSLE